MKVGIFSDTHLGFDEKGERSQESFDNLAQAIRLCIDEGADVMVLCGDVFDAPVPSHNTLYNAVRAFSLAKEGSSSVSLSLKKEGEKSFLSYSGVPILAIHGNHEYLGKETKTALDVMHLAGLVTYFHAAEIIVEKGIGNAKEELVVHGLGAVPEKKALAVMQQWKSEPVAGAANIMLLHQSFKEFMAIDDEMVATLSLDDLPKGFGLIVNGHLHWANRQELGQHRHSDGEIHGVHATDTPKGAEPAVKTIFLLAGSTIATSIKKLECEYPKGIHIFDTTSGALSFMPLPRQRKMFYRQLTLREADSETATRECRAVIAQCLQTETPLKPLVRVNMKGSLKRGISPSDVNLAGIFEEFSGRAILSISKNFSAIDFKRKIADLREMQKLRLSVAQMGLEMLEKNLSETDFGEWPPAKELFGLLEEEEVDKAMQLLTSQRGGK